MRELKNKLLIIVIFIICLSGITKADLAGKINGIIRKSSQKKVQFSIHIVKADSGKTIYSHRSTSALIPASNMKIIITAAALKYLGSDYEYKTKIGLLNDTLIIIGSGDPLLGDEETDNKYSRKKNWIFNDIAARLKQNSIRNIKDIIVDTTIFDDQRVHPNWPRDELNRWYACEVSGLNFNENCVWITAKNNSGKVTIFVEPQTDYIKFTNKVKSVSKDSNTIGSYRNREPNKIIIFGECRKQAGPFDVAIERPAAFYAYLLAENLAKEGINAYGQIVEKAATDYNDINVLVEYVTPLTDCLARCNKDSLGLAAEALLKTIAAESRADRKNGSWDKGREIISQYLSGLDIDSREFHIDDASGLSQHNRLSANAITKVLLHIYKSDDWPIYKESLAVGGVDGTIDKYFKERKYKGKIFGKTGYISGAKSFSGICSTSEGDYIFSILANKTNGQTRKAINDIAQAIIDNAKKE